MQEIAHDMEIEKFYIDTAKSGRFTENRPEYNRMKEEIQNGTIQAKTIVVRALDRLHRNVAHQKYMGTYVYDRTESKDSVGRRNSHKEKAQYIQIPNGMPAIISEKDFQKTQENMRKNATKQTHRTGRTTMHDIIREKKLKLL